MEGKKSFKKISYILALLGSIYICVLLIGIGNFWEQKKETSNIAIEKAITNAALQCYALEGSFPPSIEYLQKNYGVVVNKEVYFYHYQTNGANIMPDIKVIKRWTDYD